MFARFSFIRIMLFATSGGMIAVAQSRIDHNTGAPAQMARAAAQRHLIDKGAKGQESRKESRAFDGVIEQTVGPLPPGLQGSLTRREAKHPPDTGELPGRVVTMSASRMAQFEAQDGPAPVENQRRALARSASKSGARDATDPRAQLTAPSYGARLSPVQSFSWTAGSNVDFYYLWIGSCQDCTDILDESEGRNLSRTVNMPTDGRRIYLTLFSSINGLSYWFDYQFDASNGLVPAQLITPNNGDTLTNPQRFVWDSGSGVDDYYIQVGSFQDCNDILDEDEGQEQSRTVNLPADGRTIYLSLFSSIQGNWYYYDYQFRAPSQATNVCRANVTNNLAYSLNIFVNGSAAGSVEPFKTQYVDVSVFSLGVSFELIRPTLDGRPLGDTLAGYFNAIDNCAGEYNFVVSNKIGGDLYFLPEISNRTAAPLYIDVNGGLQAENKCNCFAPAFTDNVATGYHRLFSNSNVRLFRDSSYAGRYLYFGVDAAGNTSLGGPLYKSVEDGSGVLHLTAASLP